MVFLKEKLQFSLFTSIYQSSETHLSVSFYEKKYRPYDNSFNMIIAL